MGSDFREMEELIGTAGFLFNLVFGWIRWEPLCYTIGIQFSSELRLRSKLTSGNHFLVFGLFPESSMLLLILNGLSFSVCTYEWNYIVGCHFGSLRCISKLSITCNCKFSGLVFIMFFFVMKISLLFKHSISSFGSQNMP